MPEERESLPVDLLNLHVEEDPKQKVAILLDELFVKNFTKKGGRWISPLNAEAVERELEQDETYQEKIQKEKELYAAFLEVQKGIERDGGISEATYESYKFVINSLARDMVQLRHWASGESYRCEEEDREAKRVTSEQIVKIQKRIAEFREVTETLQDGDYPINMGEATGDMDGFFEGTLFQTQFNAQGNLEQYRIFHQGHMNGVNIRTVNIPQLVEKIEESLRKFREETSQQFQFTLDREGYLQKIEEFNAQYGPRVTIEVMGNTVVAKFSKNLPEVAETLLQLAKQNGIEVQLDKMPMSYTLVQTVPPYAYIELSLRDADGKLIKFDPEIHSDMPTITFPYEQPEFAKQLITLYLNQ